MKDQKNPDQNPESEFNSAQEENPSAIDLTEIHPSALSPTGEIPEPVLETPDQETEPLPIPDPVAPEITDQKTETDSAEIPEPSGQPEPEQITQPEPSGQPEPEQVVQPEPSGQVETEQVVSSESQSPEEDLLPNHQDEDHDDELDHEEMVESEEDLNNLSQEELLDLLEKAVSESDLNTVKTRIALIKVVFLRKKEEMADIPREEEETDEHQQVRQKENLLRQEELEKRFQELFSVYKSNRARFLEEQEKQKKDNLEKKFQILEDLRSLINSEETLKKTYDEFKAIQDKWKEIGMVPRTEINNLWQNYHFLVEKFFEKVKLNKELKDLDLKKNMEAKIGLCERTEELLLEPSILKSFKQLQKYHEEWKEIGPVPTEKKDEIWERFKTATDKINDRRREYYTGIEEEHSKNLETKHALCQQAEELLASVNESLKDWQENTNKINELLKIWKSVGPVPQKHNSEVWHRFKTSLDAFFASKKEYFDSLKDQQMHNYNIKLDLCMQAEAIKGSTDWKKTTQELIRLQDEWKKIGPVPRKHSDKIWKRFRTACDEFFQAKSSHFSNIKHQESDNLKLKEELLAKLRAHDFSEDKARNLEDLKEFQREWTRIGFVPFGERDRLQNEFRKLVNDYLDKLRISEAEMSAMKYESRLESIKQDPQSRKLLFRERDNLSGKISQLREDINLWENNIGFLANSKNANILKAEFEKKIERAKNELKVLEAKLKMLVQP